MAPCGVVGTSAAGVRGGVGGGGGGGGAHLLEAAEPGHSTADQRGPAVRDLRGFVNKKKIKKRGREWERERRGRR